MDLQGFPPEVASLPPHVLKQLLDVANEKATPTTIGFFSVPTFVYFCILYLFAKALERSFQRFSTVYPKLTWANQRTCVIYVLNTIVTAVAFGLQMAASPALGSNYSQKGFEYARICCILISGLYIFELTYRESLRWPMILHHMSTMAAIFLLNVVQARTMHPSIMVSGLLWLFQATTEQSVFIGLFMYRFRYPPKLVANILYFGAISSMICKLGFAVYLFAWWGMKQVKNTAQPLDIVYSCCLVILVVTLMFCQVWGAWVVWKIGRSIEMRYKATSTDQLESQKSPSPSVGPDTPDEEKASSGLDQSGYKLASSAVSLPRVSYTASVTQVDSPTETFHEPQDACTAARHPPLLEQ